jgi:predicted MPP superfamily phosphohydrolase
MRISWLHLTDLHVGLSGQYLWPNVESKVLEDLPGLHERTGPWDLMIFTGDAVQAGQQAEFERFEEVRSTILDAVRSLDSDPVFLAVPGNHDLERPPAVSGTVRLAQDFTNEETREDFWTNEANDLRRGVETAFANWDKWWKSHRDDDRVEFADGMLPGDYAATVKLADTTVGVIGLNTTFLQLWDGAVEGRLSLDPRQLGAVCSEKAEAWLARHDAALLLTHHSENWLDPQGRAALLEEIAEPGRFAVHLCGHQHEVHPVKRSEMGGKPRYQVLGRSLFGRDVESRLHGYSVGELASAGRDLRIRLWPRAGERVPGVGWQIVRDPKVIVREEDGGTEPEVAVRLPAGWRDTEPSGAREGGGGESAAVLRTAFDGAEEEFRRMATWLEGETSPFGSERTDKVATKLREVRGPAERAVLEIEQCIEKGQLHAAWDKYAELRGELLPRLSNELLAVIGGFYVEKERCDRLHTERPLQFSHVARYLVDGLIEETVEGPDPGFLIVSEERQAPVRAEIIRLRFPATDIWNLPFVAHEYGYLVAQRRAPQPLQWLQNEVESVVDPTNGNEDLSRHVPEVRQLRADFDRRPIPALELRTRISQLRRRQGAHVARLFADAFATYFVGPAYVQALLYVLMRPDSTMNEPTMTMPPFSQRFVFALETLQWLRDGQALYPGELSPKAQRELDETVGGLQATWRAVLEDAGIGDPYAAVAETFQPWLQRMREALDDASLHKTIVPPLYKRWEIACQLEAEISLPVAAVAPDVDPWALLNAGWSLRIKGDRSVLRAVEANIIDALAARPAPERKQSAQSRPERTPAVAGAPQPRQRPAFSSERLPPSDLGGRLKDPEEPPQRLEEPGDVDEGDQDA